ncbi:Chaperone protein DnaJ [subsurface metagenome]
MKKYIYGVIKSGLPATFGQSLFSSTLEEVYSVAHQDLACVVSNYNGNDFVSLSKEDKLCCLMAHQGIIERIMKEYTILPVKFGTLVEGDDEIRRILEQGYNKLAQTLDEIDGLVEIEVAATWDLKKVLEEIGNEEEIVQLKHSMAGKTPSEILEMQINAGKLVKESLDRRREGYRSQMMQSLAEVALDTQPNALVADEMVMNVAFLIQREKQEDFDRQVKRVDEAFNDQINFRVIGPLPPYSFSTVEIRRPESGEIEEARQLLGLGTDVSDKELKEAYRRLAAKSHPDAHVDDDTGDEQFAKVREAFVLLGDYCQGQGESVEENVDGQRYSLVSQDVSQAFLIEIKRPALQMAGALG